MSRKLYRSDMEQKMILYIKDQNGLYPGDGGLFRFKQWLQENFKLSISTTKMLKSLDDIKRKEELIDVAGVYLWSNPRNNSFSSNLKDFIELVHDG